MSVQMAEIFFGAAPQFCLQLYILGYYGNYDGRFLMALCLQGIFVTYGIVYFLYQPMVIYDDEMDVSSPAARQFLIILLFTPWAILFVISSIPLALCASLNQDASFSDHMAVLIYFLFHLFFSACFFTIAVEMKGGSGKCEVDTVIQNFLKSGR